MNNKWIGLVVLAVVGAVAYGQTNATFVKGTMDIRYNSRVQPGKVGVTDDYKMNLNISNSAVFDGTIKHYPLIQGALYGVSQNSSLVYELNGGVVNPRNPAQTRTVARIYGKVPITQEGIYQYDSGNLMIGLIVQGTESKFGGTVLGKPLLRKKGWFESLQQEALSLTRGSKGKVVLKKYDKMVFQNHKIPSGPIAMYPELTINGTMLYDYDRYVWYFDNVTINYYYNNSQRADRLTGNIRWVESSQRKTNGEGEYQFDVRFNEKPASESALFADAANEASFFEVDNTVPALVGTMKYKDSMRGETVAASNIKVDLAGQQLDKQQVMGIFKLIFFSCAIPFNSE